MSDRLAVLVGGLVFLGFGALGCPPGRGGGAVCGNMRCEAGETYASCPADCLCGNGTLDPATESCDGSALNGQTCDTLGHNGGGTLACAQDCTTFDETGCLDLLPDLMVYAGAMRSSLQFTAGYNLNSCEVALGCSSNPAVTTNRRLLEFDLVSENVGTAPLILGSPSGTEPPYAGLWAPLPAGCGYNGWIDYSIYWLCPSTETDCAGVGSNRVATGKKASFCYIENFPSAPDYTGPPVSYSCNDGTYTCGWMGQRPGCADNYYRGLDCQWIDITDIGPGTYTMCAEIDSNNHIRELREDNNISCITNVVVP